MLSEENFSLTFGIGTVLETHLSWEMWKSWRSKALPSAGEYGEGRDRSLLWGTLDLLL